MVGDGTIGSAGGWTNDLPEGTIRPFKPAGISDCRSESIFTRNSGPAFTPEMEETTQAYIAQLKEMTEMLSHFTAQAESLSHDAEQMSALNRNLAGINAIYEMPASWCQHSD